MLFRPAEALTAVETAAPAPQRRGPLPALLAAAVLLPVLLAGVAAWVAWRQTWREAVSELEHTADAAAEYAGRVLDGLALRVGRANDLLAGLSDEEVRAREPELHLLLRRASDPGTGDTRRPPYLYVYDRDARPLVSSNVLPVVRPPVFALREFNQALRDPAAPSPHVSQVYVGSTTREPYFAVTRRREGAGNGLPEGAYDGVINASVYAEDAGLALRQLAGKDTDVVSLVRHDGAILARSVGFGPPGPGARIGEESPMLPAMRAGEERRTNIGRSTIDGVTRIAAYRRVRGYPVYAAAARPAAAVTAAWRGVALGYGALGLLASGLLGVLAVLVRRREAALAEANLALERRVAERTAALARSGALLGRVQRIGRVGGFDIDLRTGVNFRTGEYMRVQGAAPHDRVEQHADWVARLHPADRDRAERRFLAAIADGAPDTAYAQDYRIVTEAGETRWIAARAEIERDAAGRALRVVGAHVDVTELKAAQQALAENEARLSAAMRGARFGVWERHLPSSSGSWDARATEIYGGLTPERCSPDLAEWRERVHPEDRAHRFAAIEAAVAAGGRDSYDIEFRFRRDDGGWNWVAVHGAVVERDAASGRAVRLAGVVQDVTARRIAEEVLRESEARLRLAQDAAGIGSWDWDVATGALHWSASCHRLHGTDPALPPAYDAWLAGIHPEDRPEVEAALRAALAGDAAEWSIQFRFTRPTDGETRWILGRGRILRDPATGAARRLIGIALDTTERKATEERQRLLARELDHRAKNTLSVVQAAVRLTPREDAESFARAIEGRVGALARAHTLLARGSWSGTDLRALAEAELAPFLRPAGGQPPMELAGETVRLSPGAAQALSMALHELATNATKYGALSGAGGTVRLSWTAGATLSLRWEERGGPPVLPPSRRGFGSRLVEATVRDQLGGQIRRSWAREGLVCEMAVPMERLEPREMLRVPTP